MTRADDRRLDVLLTDAAHYIAGYLACYRLLETTDPHGWALARRLATLADALYGGDLSAEIEATLAPVRTVLHDHRSHLS